MKRVLVTGGSGFVGRVLCIALLQSNYIVRLALREKIDCSTLPGCEYGQIDTINAQTDWSTILEDVDVVIHLAARVHVMRDSSADALTAFRVVNVQGTERLVEQAIDAGVKRFIFVSSLHVNGICSGEQPFQETDVPHPSSPYALSKWEAEQSLRRLANNTSLEWVIVRPPLVYGPHVRANFLSLLKIVSRSIPLPFRCFTRQRSLISVKNLANFLICCIEPSAATNQVFLVSDGEDISLYALITRLSRCFRKPARLFSVPVKILYGIGKVLHFSKMLDRLGGALQANISQAKKLLHWTPVQTLDEGLQETVDWFLKKRR